MQIQQVPLQQHVNWRMRGFWFIFILIALSGIGIGLWAFLAARDTAVIVEWSTASELETVGFNLFRSDRADGSYSQVNDHLIPASPDSLTGGEYSYRDTKVKAGQEYFYLLEDVDADGNTHRNGPIQVKAESGGWIAILASIALIGVSGFGMITLSLTKQQKNDR